ncbi:MAG: radical SAM protein [bacterium]|nr:radical SAM protein [bacterium]
MSRLNKIFICRYFKNLNQAIVFNKKTDSYSLINGIGALIVYSFLKGNSKNKIEKNIISLAYKKKIIISHKFIVDNIKLIINWLNAESILFVDKEQIMKSQSNKNEKLFNAKQILDSKKIRRLYAGEKLPMSAFIEVSSMCNFQCIHCYNKIPSKKSKTSEDLSLNEIIEILNWLKEKKCLRVTISGGEPLIRKDFLNIIKMAIDRNFAVVVFTNGYLLNKALIKHLESLGVYKLEISVLGANEKTYKEICGVTASEHIKTLLPILSKTNMRIRIKTPVLAMNYRQIPAMEKLCASYGLRYTYDITQMRKGLYRNMNQNVFCSLSQIDWLINKVGRESLQQEEDIRGPNSANCYSGAYSFAIDAKGNVFPCATLRYGSQNIRNKSIDEIWGSDEIRMHHNIKVDDLKTCNICSIKNYCKMCPGAALLANGNLYTPDEYQCGIMKLIYKDKL